MFYRKQRRPLYDYFLVEEQRIIAVAYVRAPNISDVDSRSRREQSLLIAIKLAGQKCNSKFLATPL